MKLEGKVALVTGAGKGIGKAISIGLAKEGASVIVNYNSDEKSAHEVAKQIEAAGLKSLAIRADVSKENEVREMVRTALKFFGRIDILVNNAGIYNRSDFEKISLDEWEKTFSVNVTGTFLCSRETVPHMKANGFGRIVNISSLAAIKGGALKGVHYSTSKAAVIGFTKALAKAVSGHDIRVNALAPGPVEDSGMTNDDTPNVRKKRIEATLLKRMCKPEDIAKAVVFLASEDSDYITGETIRIDGGMLLV